MHDFASMNFNQRVTETYFFNMNSTRSAFRDSDSFRCQNRERRKPTSAYSYL